MLSESLIIILKYPLCFKKILSNFIFLHQNLASMISIKQWVQTNLLLVQEFLRQLSWFWE